MSIKENLYSAEASRRNLAQQIASESAVLLKNDACLLPLPTGTVAMLGQALYNPNLGGMGSGMSFMGKQIPSITEACSAAGLTPEPGLDRFYREYFASVPPENPFAKFMELRASGVDLVASGAIYDLFGQYEPQKDEILPPPDLIETASRITNTALLCFGRSTGGEECDRHLENDYSLLDSEKELIRRTCTFFEKVVLLINTNGLTDLSWIRQYPSIQAVLFIGAGGERGPAAVADLLIGQETPSGKLAFTIADSYESYPTASDFSFDKDHPENILEYSDYQLDAKANGSTGFSKSPVTVYREGLYMGYRYFDSFGKDVLYPFGFGLSYAEFKISDISAKLLPAHSSETQAPVLCLTADVRNLSERFSGKEVLQLYVSSPSVSLEQPFQSYKGCVKTPLIPPKGHAEVSVEVSVRDLASYDEAAAAWILEAGEYLLRLGTSSRNTQVAARLQLPETIVCEKTVNCLSLQTCNRGKISFLSAKDAVPICFPNESAELACAPVITLNQADVVILDKRSLSVPSFAETNVPASPEKARPLQLIDVKEHRVSMKEFLAQMTDDELMALAVGYGPGLPFASMLGGDTPNTITDTDGKDLTENTHPSGNMGYISPAIKKYGLPSAFYKDGPASVGKIAWPTGMTLSCSFNRELFYAFGSACAKECEELQVDSWLAPALNLHRNPICGRNFEYFSEDPFAAGICGAYICKGAAETSNVTCCPKHFALNEQETYRRGSSRKSYDAADSIVTERTARELYLKPFEITLREAPVRTLMTSFNKINGTFAAGNYDLCTRILRNEWGYEGVVVTDWGDMDIVVDGADAVAAGNDIVMPGGPPVIAQIQEGFAQGRVNRDQLETAISHLLSFVMESESFAIYTQDMVH